MIYNRKQNHPLRKLWFYFLKVEGKKIPTVKSIECAVKELTFYT
jgi:hypothetical protein